jgi:hypothetical protein
MDFSPIIEWRLEVGEFLVFNQLQTLVLEPPFAHRHGQSRVQSKREFQWFCFGIDNALCAHFNAEHLSGDALGFADVLAGFVNRDAIGSVEVGGAEQEDQNQPLPGRTAPSTSLRAGFGGCPHMCGYWAGVRIATCLDSRNNAERSL